MAKTLTTGEILSYLLHKNDMSEVSLGRAIGVPRATINRITSGRTSDPRASTLNAIAEFFSITTEQLLGLKPIVLENEQAMVEKNYQIPILEWNEAKNWQYAIERIKENDSTNWVLSNSLDGEAEFALLYKGESMWPQFQENTLLIVSTKRESKNNDFVVAHIRSRDEIVFRKLIIENKYWILKANNRIFPSLHLEKEDKIIGTVIQSRNNF
jgi:SOS-response transcriptional repressor LexA